MKYRYEAINVDLGVWMVQRHYERDGQHVMDESPMRDMGDDPQDKVIQAAIKRDSWAGRRA